MTISIRDLSASSGLVVLASLLAAVPASAQTTRAFDIAAGPLDSALVTFATQAEAQLLYTPDLVSGLRTQGVRGPFAPSVALARLLSGSGLLASESRPGVFVLRRAPGFQGDLETTDLGEVLVTGSLIRGPSASPSPITTLSTEDMDRAGRGSVAEALGALPQNFGGTATPATFLSVADAGGSNTTLSTGIDLRGLGPDSTLVLLNGRRLAGTGSRGEFADLSSLPNAAVERVDVLLDGASALYGSDAVGGVVNVILRRDFDGQESRLRIGAAEGGAEELMTSHVIGRRWSSGAALLSWEYREQAGLSGSDRSYAATGDLRPWGGPDHRTLFSSAGNIVAFDPVSAGYVATHAIRPGASGAATSPSDFVAGQANLSDRRAGAEIVPTQERQSVYARLRQGLGDRLEVSADVRYSLRDFAFATVAPAEIIRVTTANPHFVSPSGASAHQIAYSFINDVAPQDGEGSARSLGATAGFDLPFLGDWNLSAYGAWAEERSHVFTPRLQFAYLYEALGVRPDSPATDYSPARDGFFNPFGAGGLSNPLVNDLIGSGYTVTRQRSRVTSGNLLADGTVWSLPGGDLKLAVGGQYRREAFDRATETYISTLTPVTTAIAPQSRDIAALFAEARIPLVGTSNRRPGLERLELSLAVRAEHYEDFGSTTNPKIGLVWAPTEAFAVRASWGSSFRAPSLNELNEAVVIGATSTFEGGVEKLAVIQLGGNPDLTPETADTLTLGFDYTRPEAFRLSLSLFDIRFTDRIGRPVAENIDNALVDPALTGFVRRVDPSLPADLAAIEALINDPRFVPPGLYPAEAYAALLDGRWLNTGELRVRGLDFSLAHGIRLDAGRFDLDLAASWLFEYSRKLTPEAASETLLDQVGYPVDLRAQAGVRWTQEAWSARLGLNYVDDYRTSTGGGVDAWLTADAQIRWSPTAIAGVSGLDLTLNVRNLFDADPPFFDAASGYGFDAGQADPLGRVVSLQLTRRW